MANFVRFSKALIPRGESIRKDRVFWLFDGRRFFYRLVREWGRSLLWPSSFRLSEPHFKNCMDEWFKLLFKCSSQSSQKIFLGFYGFCSEVFAWVWVSLSISTKYTSYVFCGSCDWKAFFFITAACCGESVMVFSEQVGILCRIWTRKNLSLLELWGSLAVNEELLLRGIWKCDFSVCDENAVSGEPMERLCYKLWILLVLPSKCCSNCLPKPFSIDILTSVLPFQNRRLR